MIYVERKLWYQRPGEEQRTIIDQADLLGLSKCSIVLGEPGMGKSALLKKLAQTQGGAFCAARKLINTHDPRTLLGNAMTLVIDGLDEVTARREGGAVDLVLQKLSQLGDPPFVLSCRVADWQAAISAETIREIYDDEPLLLHLIELNREDQITLLMEEVGCERTEQLLEHFETFGLDLLGNPQTLLMIARLSRSESLPTTTGALFMKAIDQLWCEHRKGHGATELDREAALDAAGAAFASLILTGSSAVVRHGATYAGESELALAEVDRLAGGNLAQIIGSRLFEGGEDSFTYWHRRIGEFLGARWLAKRADLPAKRRRLLQLFHSHGLVPANLRGLHAWLARDPKLAAAVISADPLGIVEYGDADALSEEQARALFNALRELFRRQSQFLHWNDPRARALVSSAMRADADRALGDRTAPFALRTLLLKQLKDPATAEVFQTTLQRLLFDEAEVFAIRSDAGAVLRLLGDSRWRTWIEDLRRQGTGDALRLAFELMMDVGLGSFSDEEVVSVIFAYEGLTISSAANRTRIRPAGRLWLPEMAIPGHRLSGLLDVFSDYAADLLPDDASTEHHALIDLAFELILKWLEFGDIDPLRLWFHLAPYAEQHSYNSEKEARLASWIRRNDNARHLIQRHVLLNCPPDEIWNARVQLGWRSDGLVPSDQDTAVLIGALSMTLPPDERWRQFLGFIVHDAQNGRVSREAAARLVANDPELLDWIDRLGERRAEAWEAEEARRERRASAREALRVAEARSAFTQHLGEVRAGDLRWLAGPASAYLKLIAEFRDVDPPEQRIVDWLGEEITAAVLVGFEAFLVGTPSLPCTARFAVMHANKRRYTAGIVLVAALAERVRTWQEPFKDLPDERLTAILYELWQSHAHTHAGLPDLLDRLEDEIRQRGCWEGAIRLYVKPQLKRRIDTVDPLYRLMRSERDTDLAVRLALDWLRAYADLPTAVEAELIDRVLQSRSRDELRSLGDLRRTRTLDDERRRNWDAVQIFVDITKARGRLGSTIERELLWHLRAREYDWHRDKPTLVNMSAEQLGWIFAVLRVSWPPSGYPSGAFWGDRHPWDASDYLTSLLARLGEDTAADATHVLKSLRDMPVDGYTDRIKAVLAEHRRKRVEATYVPPKLNEVRAIVDAGPPTTPSDLQAVVLEALEVVQERLKGDPVDWYRGFFLDNGTVHKDEEDCRDELIKMLEAIDGSLEYIPELHLADDKRVDIVARAGRDPILPIEIKGTWHRALWASADLQLDHLYVGDWRAERGIYLVLWFGAQKLVTTPPAGLSTPNSPEELREMLVSQSRAAREGRISVVVIDVSRPAPA